MIKLVLFDLDGTLLPMNQELFTQNYMGALANFAFPNDEEKRKRIIKAVWYGVSAIVKNDGSKTNEDAFWQAFGTVSEDFASYERSYFDIFYDRDFNAVLECCGYNKKAADTLRLTKSLGIRAALATNPIFPAAATYARIKRAGLSPDDFEFITTYENSSYSKPNPNYYRELMARFPYKPEECLMVGNDVGDDMVAKEVGMKVFLLTDCLINPKGADVSAYPNGDFDKLTEYIKTFV